ncbi:SbcC/MukB-like Walker B domain-containing protein [Cytobacillus sp. FJAT-54145]|uniref:Nuclease SbcCD subunit C n=1 Tax=Cytobacillus spartinae TaxID=3299023 RepID=A0ABW6K8F5_9BACI
MRPLILTMQAFGPYAGTETIDFTQLENRTMFVISGKTGSGKTTIFDGISFAIYGKASGEDRNGQDLRSQFAHEDLLTEVTLQFTLRGKVYRITRSPQQEKKKERGDGTRTIGAKAELYLVNEQGELQLIAANVRDVDEKIKEIMLIDSNQFRQILMIPQGEFRKLLTSDSKDKELILQRLFHTEMYKRVEEKLKEEATELRKSVEKHVEDRNQSIRRIQGVYNEELIQYIEAESVNDTILLPLLADEITKMATQLASLVKAEEVEKEKRDEIQKKIHEAQNTINQLKSLDALRIKKEHLEGQREEYLEKERAVDLGKRAALLAQQEELCHRLKRELDEYQKDLTVRKSRIEELSILLKEREQAWTSEKNREEERKHAQDECNRLVQMKEDVQSFARIRKEVSDLHQRLQEVKNARKLGEETLKKLEEKIKGLQESKQQIEKEQITFLENERSIEKLELQLEGISKYEQILKQHNQMVVVVEQQNGEFLQVNARLKDARELVEKLETSWLHGQASILAAKLHEGDHCPVCGSTHHPNLANQLSRDGIPDEKDLKVAKKQATEIEQEKAKVESKLYEVQSELKSIEQKLTELWKDVLKQEPSAEKENITTIKNSITSRRTELLEQQESLKRNKARLDKVILDLKNYEENKETVAKQLLSHDEELTDLTIQFTEKNTNYNRMMEKVPENLRSLEDFNRQLKLAIERQDELQKKLEESQQKYQECRENHATEQAGYVTVEKHYSEKEKELTIEREVFVKNMDRQGFENYGAYKEAKRTDEQIQVLEQEIRNYREELRSVTDRFAELSQLLKDVKEPNLEELNKRLNESNASIKGIEDQKLDLVMKKRDNEDILAKVSSINEKMKELEDRYKLVGHLYEISKGQNTYRVTFERYVLAAFLDDILQEANGRLSKMTSGRYQLLRKTDRSKGSAQSGLELLVFDQYTGQERHVKTLSGGESFKASLSLALGLADVVQQYAGGVSLETMFIDEGFGTLDPESLDQAIEALIDIQSSGRLVGIISHVPELKERIDVRLEVIASQTGSMTKFHFLNS